MKMTAMCVTIVSLSLVELQERNNRGSFTGQPQGILAELWRKSFTVICFRSELLRSFTFMSSSIHLPTEKKVQLGTHRLWVLWCSVCLNIILTSFYLYRVIGISPLPLKCKMRTGVGYLSSFPQECFKSRREHRIKSNSQYSFP